MKLGSNSAYNEQRKRTENNNQQTAVQQQPQASAISKWIGFNNMNAFNRANDKVMNSITNAVPAASNRAIVTPIPKAEFAAQKKKEREGNTGANPSSRETLYSYLQSIGVNPNDLKARQQLAQDAGISNYNRTASQNIQLLRALKEKKAMEDAEILNANERAERAARIVGTPATIQPMAITPMAKPTKFNV